MIKRSFLSIICLISFYTIYTVSADANETTTTFVVDDTSDKLDTNIGDGLCATQEDTCTLRAAIQEANALAGTVDSITLPSGTYLLTIAGQEEDEAAFGDLDIQVSLALIGADKETTIIDGNQLDRVFHLLNEEAYVSFTNLTIQGGDIGNSGGGIYSNSALQLENAKIASSVAQEGGGLYASLLSSEVYIINTEIVSNSAWYGGGIYSHSTLTVRNSHFIGNRAYGVNEANGSAILALNKLSIDRSAFTGNIAGAFNRNSIVSILHSDSSIERSIFHNNVFEGIPDFRNGLIYNKSNNLLLSETTLYQNIGTPILNTYGASMTINKVAVYDNETRAEYFAEHMAGGINNLSQMTIIDSTISNNRSITFSSISPSELAGGIRNQGNLTIRNSTISGNVTDGFGGGILNTPYSLSNPKLTLQNVTIANNVGDADSNGLGNGGGIYNRSGSVTLVNTIIAGNSDNNPNVAYTDCYTESIWQSEGYNLIQDSSHCILAGDTTGNLLDVDPMLDTLQDNGGSTLTHALLPSSPAIDAGNPNGCGFIADQRGWARHQDGNEDDITQCDIGAYEMGDALPDYFYRFLPIIK